MVAGFRAVNPMTSKDIEHVVTSFREYLGIAKGKPINTLNLIERVLPDLLPDYTFCVLPDEDMPGMDGLTATGGDLTIYLSETTYVALYGGSLNAIITAAHELGHLILHSQQSPAFAKRTHDDERVDPEWQADRFAEMWLMPRDGVERCRSARHVAAKYGVTDEMAEKRFLEVKHVEIQGELF